MADYGYRSVDPGEKLTSDHMNTIAGQTVMRFQNATERTNQLGSGTPRDGMVSYLNTDGRMETYDGTAWVPFNAAKGGYYSILWSVGATSLPGVGTPIRVNFGPSVEGGLGQAPGYRNMEVSNTSSWSGLKIPVTGLWYCLLHTEGTTTATAGSYIIEFEVSGTRKPYGIRWPSQFPSVLSVPVMYPLTVNDVVGAQARYLGSETGSLSQVHLTVAGPL